MANGLQELNFPSSDAGAGEPVFGCLKLKPHRGVERANENYLFSTIFSHSCRVCLLLLKNLSLSMCSPKGGTFKFSSSSIEMLPRSQSEILAPPNAILFAGFNSVRNQNPGPVGLNNFTTTLKLFSPCDASFSSKFLISLSLISLVSNNIFFISHLYKIHTKLSNLIWRNQQHRHPGTPGLLPQPHRGVERGSRDTGEPFSCHYET